ncbi:MAG TPA: Mor transcription activator family protein [Gammaproteobacteria bacterium]|nr:hypothetical protein [Chromatiaceae bacterium]HPE80997.1 Mor transcription activator family protein [Gammaproteobacteria bacterium]
MTSSANSEREPRYYGPGAELLNEIWDLLTVVFEAHPAIADEYVHDLVSRSVECLRGNLGGSLIYFPKGVAHDMNTRNETILSEFNGHNHQDLARKYNLATQQIYKLIKTAGR